MNPVISSTILKHKEKLGEESWGEIKKIITNFGLRSAASVELFSLLNSKLCMVLALGGIVKLHKIQYTFLQDV